MQNRETFPANASNTCRSSRAASPSPACSCIQRGSEPGALPGTLRRKPRRAWTLIPGAGTINEEVRPATAPEAWRLEVATRGRAGALRLWRQRTGIWGVRQSLVAPGSSSRMSRAISASIADSGAAPELKDTLLSGVRARNASDSFGSGKVSR